MLVRVKPDCRLREEGAMRTSGEVFEIPESRYPDLQDLVEKVMGIRRTALDSPGDPVKHSPIPTPVQVRAMVKPRKIPKRKSAKKA